MLQYLELFYQIENFHHQVYLSILVDDNGIVNTKAIKLIDTDTQNSLLKGLIDIIKDNIFMAKNLKFEIANFTQFDLILNHSKLLKDIKSIINFTEIKLTSKALEYVETYEEIYHRIVEIENSNLPKDMIETFIDMLLSRFEHFGYDFIISLNDIKLPCILHDELITENQNIEFIKGLPIGICRKHREAGMISKLLRSG